MADASPEFWKLDLTKLTLAGWLLMLASIATVLGVSAALLGLLSWLLGAGNQRPSRLVAGLAVVAAIAVGAGVFALGQNGLSRLGLRVLRG
jgi:hypothetical protein